MLQVILSWLKAKAEELLAEEQAGFRLGWSNSHHREASTAPARSVPQLNRIQESVWQSLACRPVADPQKLQHRGRTGSSHSGIIWELQQHSPVEQSARGVLRDNSRCSSGMLTFTHPVQLVPGEDHAGNTPWPPHIHLHWWKVGMQPMICWRHQSYGQQQWWTSRPHQQTRRLSNGIWNWRQHRKEQGHDQQHKQH